MPQSRGDRHLFSTSDGNAMMRQILPLMPLMAVNSMSKLSLTLSRTSYMHRATPTIPGMTPHGAQAQLDEMDDKALHNGLADMLELLACTINRISCIKCSGGGDAHTTTVALFNTLTSYPWDTKVVIALAAFAVTYGEFWLVAQVYPTNPLAKSVAHLKQLPNVVERANSLKPKFEAVTSLIKEMLYVTNCVVKFKDLPPQYITADTPEMITATPAIVVSPLNVSHAVELCYRCSAQ